MNSPELYHGTPLSGIKTLTPRQAMNAAYPDRVEEAAVYASDDIDYSIFMAIIGKRQWGGWNKKQFGGKGFYIYEEFEEYLNLSQYEEPTGTVYFLGSDSFEQKAGHEWHSRSPVRVLGSLAVGVQDLPQIAINPARHPYHFR